MKKPQLRGNHFKFVQKLWGEVLVKFIFVLKYTKISSVLKL